jgi:hypothetical protein
MPIKCPMCDAVVTLPCTCAGTLSSGQPCGAVLRAMEPTDPPHEGQLAKATNHLCELMADGSWTIWSLQRPAGPGEIVAANGIWVSWRHIPAGMGEAEQAVPA